MAQARWRSSAVAALVLVVSGLVACAPTQVVTGEARMVDEAVNAGPGDCLIWPEQQPDMARIVDCSQAHRFEIAEVVDVSDQYGPDAAPPTTAEIRELSQQRCQPAARSYLGPKYDPNGRFTIAMLWRGERHWRDTGTRLVLCGLQQSGPNGTQPTFVGRVADQDQSKTWPAGTCIGIDPASHLPTDLPVACAAPHAMEVTGTVGVGARFPGGLPAEADQDAFVKDGCVKATDAYLAPVTLRETTLTVVFSTIQQASWDAGSRQVACLIGAVSGAGWATLLNSAKGPLLIDGRPPAP
ncbi:MULTISPECIES: septum formation family protein [unclassified Mycobacterium]|uniref:septum formation family protein n=1 Tax=unclassified Mycobacterium TaxID=2642494 RepID=UPI0029C9401E|nr:MULTISPECIES: septum formation family protein [unclassified Mycobacterium]